MQGTRRYLRFRLEEMFTDLPVFVDLWLVIVPLFGKVEDELCVFLADAKYFPTLESLHRLCIGNSNLLKNVLLGFLGLQRCAKKRVGVLEEMKDI